MSQPGTITVKTVLDTTGLDTGVSKAKTSVQQLGQTATSAQGGIKGLDTSLGSAGRTATTTSGSMGKLSQEQQKFSRSRNFHGRFSYPSNEFG